MPQRQLVGEDRRLDQWRRLLGAYDYQRQLERGYSVTRDATGRVVRSVDGIELGALLRTRVADGEVVSTVEETSGTAQGPPRHPSGDNHNEEGTT
jgi:exodeoxyribonuclease VII large subunit